MHSPSSEDRGIPHLLAEAFDCGRGCSSSVSDSDEALDGALLSVARSEFTQFPCVAHSDVSPVSSDAEAICGYVSLIELFAEQSNCLHNIKIKRTMK